MTAFAVYFLIESRLTLPDRVLAVCRLVNIRIKRLVTCGGGVVNVHETSFANALPFADFVPAGIVAVYFVAIGKRSYQRRKLKWLRRANAIFLPLAALKRPAQFPTVSVCEANGDHRLLKM